MNNHEMEARRRKVETLKGTRETRSFAAEIEIRDNTEDGIAIARGLACATTHVYSLTSMDERVMPGAFKRTLSSDPAPHVVFLAQHEGLPLASTRGGGLTLRETERGLYFEARMDATDPDVDRVVRKIRRGDLTGASFAFRVTDDEFDPERNLRTIKCVELHGGDVSACSMGANDLASVSVRAASLAEIPLRMPSAAQRARERLVLIERGRIARNHLTDSSPSYDSYRERVARLRG